MRVDAAEVLRLRLAGHSFRGIATLLGTSLASVQRALKRVELERDVAATSGELVEAELIELGSPPTEDDELSDDERSQLDDLEAELAEKMGDDLSCYIDGRRPSFPERYRMRFYPPDLSGLTRTERREFDELCAKLDAAELVEAELDARFCKAVTAAGGLEAWNLLQPWDRREIIAKHYG